MFATELGRLRTLPRPSHCQPTTMYPPTALADVYARGQFGLSLMKTPPVRAAVLVPLVAANGGELSVLLTLRTRRLKRHSGEVALPGGKADAADRGDDVATALREAEEEVGLQPSQVEVLCEMERTVAVGGLLTGVVVAVINDKDFEPAPNPGEVAAVFTIPLRTFLQSNPRHRHEDLVATSGLSEGDRPMRMHYFEHTNTALASSSECSTQQDSQKFVIWGLTAGILIHVAECAFAEKPQFEKDAPVIASSSTSPEAQRPQLCTANPVSSHAAAIIREGAAEILAQRPGAR